MNIMSKRYLFLLGFFVSLLILFSKDGFSNSSKLKISPVTKMFVNEDRTIMFETEWNQTMSSNQKLYLYEYSTKISRKDQFLMLLGKKMDISPTIRYKWELNDQGELGDRKAGDGIYSRVISFKEKKKTTLYFFVSDEIYQKNEIPRSDMYSSDFISYIEIVNRPSFLEMLGIAWDKFTK